MPARTPVFLPMHPETARAAAAAGLVLAHAGAVALGDRWPDAWAALLAGTVYGPLWGAEWLGLPVHGNAASGGWPAPSLLGWALLAVLWFSLWWGVLAWAGRVGRWARHKLPARR